MMQKGVRNTVIVLVLVVCAVLGLTFHKYSASPALDRQALRESGVVLYETPRSFVFNPLSSHDGTAFTASDLTGTWSLMYFGFTYCPDICPATLANMNQLLVELEKINPEAADNLQVVLVSVDPQRDTPEKLGQYVGFFNKEFVGVTGDSGNLTALTRQLNVAFELVGDTSTDDYLVEHSGQVVLINPKGDYQGFLKPPFQPQELAQAMTHIYQSL